MSVPEAAASLFGPEEPSTDPFAVIGTDSAQPSPPESNDLFASQDTSNFLDSFPEQDGSSFLDHRAPEEMETDYYSTTAVSYASTDVVTSTQQFHTHQTAIGGHEHEQTESYSSVYNETGIAASNESTYHPSSYHPAASVNAPSLASSSWYPDSTSTNGAYSVAAATTGTATYDPYPAYSQPSIPQRTLYPGSVYPAPPQPSSIVEPPPPLNPAPPPVTQPLNRPKVVNAYDPPFPTITARRTGRTHVHHTYGTYNAYMPAQPNPPPTPIYSNHSFPTQNPYSAQPANQAPYVHQAEPPAPPPVSKYSSQYVSPPRPPVAHPPPQVRPVQGQAPHPSHIRRPSDGPAGPTYPGVEQLGNGYGSHSDVFSETRKAEPNLTTEALPQSQDSQSQNGTQVGYGVPLKQSMHETYEPSDSTIASPVHSPTYAAHDAFLQSESSQSGSYNVAINGYASSYDPQPQESRQNPYSHAPSWAANDHIVHEKRTDSPVSLLHETSREPPSALLPINGYAQRDPSFTSGSGTATSTYDMYTPSSAAQQPREPPSAPISNHIPPTQIYNPTYDLAPPSPTSLHAPSLPYAPSPSLIGSNDPLTRTSARAPVISFGFGGRLVTCFHGASTLNTGFDVALSARNTTSLKIQVLNKLLPKSALNISEATYPGPLFSDSGSPSLGLVRSAAASQTKTKKAGVLKYLEDRASEISQGLGYHSPGERQTSEAKLILVNLLKIMVENEGQLFGSPQIDAAVRAALVPRLSPSQMASSSFSNHLDSKSLEAAPSLYAVPPEAFETPISVTTLRPSSLNKIEELLMRGERRQAYTYALDQKLWAHAMVIASSIDKEAWKEAVNEFIHTELASKDAAPLPATKPNLSDAPGFSVSGRDSLRVAYSLFSGQGAASVQELVPTKLLSKPPSQLQPAASMASQTPKTPAFPTLGSSAPEPLSKWTETVAMILSSPLTPDTSAALTALGDQLLSHNWVEAAHGCYLLSPQTSPLGGAGSPAARITLLGCRAPHSSPLLAKDMEYITLTEILEFALSLAPTVKGQDAFAGLTHLQPYKLLRAFSHAELGELQLAQRYCEAISASLARSSPYFNATFVHHLRSLTDHLSGVSHSEKSASWIGGKISKPSLDTIGGWLEGRFTKLVTGDGDSGSPDEQNAKPDQRAFAGPFAHYSTISTTPSARSSPQPIMPPHPPAYSAPQRTSSAMAVSSYHPHQPIDRASSAMDYLRNQPGRQSPALFSNSTYASHQAGGLNLNAAQVRLSGAKRDSGSFSNLSPVEVEAETPVQPPQASSWWDHSSSSAQTPTAATFMKIDEVEVQSTGDGFISLMDTQNFGFQPTPPPAPAAYSAERDLEEEVEDLGFGNREKSTKATKPASPVSAGTPATNPEPPAEKKQEAAAGGGSWISKWWKGSSETPGPIKAKLGEENSFYYDKELKRWVNKKAGVQETKSGPPPPPPRAQTASPSRNPVRLPPQSTSAPPPRSSSAMDYASDHSAPRVRSNLAPASPTTAAPPPASTRPTAGPSRPRSQATKRNIRSRYVDVFQQENTGS